MTDPLVEEIRRLAETKLPICLECRTLLRMAVTAQELFAAGKLPAPAVGATGSESNEAVLKPRSVQ